MRVLQADRSGVCIHGHKQWFLSNGLFMPLPIQQMGPEALSMRAYLCTPCSEKKWYILFLDITSQLQARFSYNFR